MKKQYFAIATIIMATLSGTVYARLTPTSIKTEKQAECMVADPTGTLLNVRDRPAGTRLGALKNSTKLTLTHFEDDERGRNWSYVKWKGQPLENATEKRHEGWVIREYISCKL